MTAFATAVQLSQLDEPLSNLSLVEWESTKQIDEYISKLEDSISQLREAREKVAEAEKKKNDKKTSKKVKELAEQLGMSPEDVAKKLGIEGALGDDVNDEDEDDDDEE